MVSWERTFPYKYLGRWGEGEGCLVEADGDLLVAGYEGCDGCGKAICVMKLHWSAADDIWERTYSECNSDYFGPSYMISSVVKTGNHGYVLAGRVENLGNYSDICLLKIDENGSKVWQRAYGGPYIDSASSIVECDGGYLIAGTTQVGGTGNYDVYLLKIDDSGGKVWQSTYGGRGYDGANCVTKSADGGFVVAGETASLGAGYSDVYLLKVDRDGNKVWERAYGGRYVDAANWIARHGAGFLVAGYTWSFGAGAYDVYLLEVDSNGNKVWERTYGGVLEDKAISAAETLDQGFVIVGETRSFGSGGYDIYLLRIDGAGNKLWAHTYGGPWDDRTRCMIESGENRFILMGNKSGNLCLLEFRVSRSVPVPVCESSVSAVTLIAMIGLIQVTLGKHKLHVRRERNVGCPSTTSPCEFYLAAPGTGAMNSFRHVTVPDCVVPEVPMGKECFSRLPVSTLNMCPRCGEWTSPRDATGMR